MLNSQIAIIMWAYITLLWSLRILLDTCTHTHTCTSIHFRCCSTPYLWCWMGVSERGRREGRYWRKEGRTRLWSRQWTSYKLCWTSWQTYSYILRWDWHHACTWHNTACQYSRLDTPLQHQVLVCIWRNSLLDTLLVIHTGCTWLYTWALCTCLVLCIYFLTCCRPHKQQYKRACIWACQLS